MVDRIIFANKFLFRSGLHKISKTEDTFTIDFQSPCNIENKDFFSLKLNEFYILPSSLNLQLLCQVVILQAILKDKITTAKSVLEKIDRLGLPKTIYFNFDLLQFVKYFATFQHQYYFEIFPLFVCLDDKCIITYPHETFRLFYSNIFWQDFYDLSSKFETEPVRNYFAQLILNNFLNFWKKRKRLKKIVPISSIKTRLDIKSKACF